MGPSGPRVHRPLEPVARHADSGPHRVGRLLRVGVVSKGGTLTHASVTPFESSETSALSPGAAVFGTATATAVILGCGIFTGLIAARSLGPAGRGELAAITTWASVLLFAGTFGLPEAVAYFAAADRASRDRVWTTGQAGALVLGLLVAAIGWWAIPAAFGADDAALAGAIRWYLILF